MNRYQYLFGFLILFTTLNSFGQSTNPYAGNVKLAKQYRQDREYLRAAESYSRAFASNKDKGLINHRYEAARCWAMAGQPDSAFYQLERIVNSGYFTKYDLTMHDHDLNSLHDDARWKKLLILIKANKEKIEPHLNEPLAAMLDSVYEEDQKYRLQMDGVEKKYGFESKEMEELWKVIHEKDAINLIKVKTILAEYGWLGADVVGNEGKSALFLVIQHANQKTQEIYLPMMREAVKTGNAPASSLALLEDRVALGKGNKQIYGSQIGRNKKTGLYFVRPLEDPENVDKRRSKVNLNPLSEYVKQWGIVWSLEQYRKDLEENVNNGQ